ncbi:MAG: DUF4140 domain-containing protein [Deinococcus sp.]|nr:DUF4140 domain-containing protein [Deinococcus sp.]
MRIFLLWTALVLATVALAQDQTQVTVYNNDLALVRLVKTVKLEAGRAVITLDQLPQALDPSTVQVRALDQGPLTILSRTFSSSPLNPYDLLRSRVGQKVILERNGVRQEATVLSPDGLFLINGQVVWDRSTDTTIIFPDLSPELPATPALAIELENGGALNRTLEITFFTRGLSWSGTYALVLSGSGQADLDASATVMNFSGADLVADQVTLVSGDINLTMPGFGFFEGRGGGVESSLAAPVLDQSGTLLTLDLGRGLALRQNESTQLSLFSATGVQAARKLQINNGDFYSPELELAARNVIEIANTTAAGLGSPLPRGLVRIFQREEDQLRFLGEDSIGNLAPGELLAVTTGSSITVRAKRTALNVQEEPGADGRGRTVYTIGYVVRNSGPAAENVDLRETLPSGSTQVTESSLPPQHPNASTLLFMLSVPAGGAVELRYTLVVE